VASAALRALRAIRARGMDKHKSE